MKEMTVSKKVLERVECLRVENRYEEIFQLLKYFSKAQDDIEKIIPFSLAMKAIKRDDNLFSVFLVLREKLLGEIMAPFLKDEEKKDKLKSIYFEINLN